MNEYYLAVSILVVNYIFVSPLIAMMLFSGEGSVSFMKDYRQAFVAFHAIMTGAIFLIGAGVGIVWAVGVVF